MQAMKAGYVHNIRDSSPKVRGESINCPVILFHTATNDSSDNMERPTTSSFRGGGTFPYISPEQLDHSLRSSVDAKTDMYSLGMILFDLHYPKVVEDKERSEVRT